MESFAFFLKNGGEEKEGEERLALVLAGGYDVRVTENVEYALELNHLAVELGIQDRVYFLFSFSDEQKLYLLR